MARVVVITGASAGVGRAIARAFGARGDRVALLARGPDGLEGARREIEAAGGRALAIAVDVADAGAVERAASEIERALGPIGVWINCAMVSVFAPVAETTAEEFRRVTEVTYLGYVHGTLAALARMRPRDRGVIVQVGSALAYRAIPLQAAYCAAKHAVKGFSESLRTELLHDRSGVVVTQVHLPAMNTPQFDWSRAKLARRPQPVPPIFQPELAAEAVLVAAEGRQREIWLGAPTITAITAERTMPAVADRFLARHGFDAQQAPEPIERARRDNLYDPLPGDWGAHGRFDDVARTRSVEWSLTRAAARARGWVIPLAFAAAGLLAVAAAKKIYSPARRVAMDRRTFADAGRPQLARAVPRRASGFTPS